MQHAKFERVIFPLKSIKLNNPNGLLITHFQAFYLYLLADRNYAYNNKVCKVCCS